MDAYPEELASQIAPCGVAHDHDRRLAPCLTRFAEPTRWSDHTSTRPNTGTLPAALFRDCLCACRRSSSHRVPPRLQRTPSRAERSCTGAQPMEVAGGGIPVVPPPCTLSITAPLLVLEQEIGNPTFAAVFESDVTPTAILFQYYDRVALVGLQKHVRICTRAAANIDHTARY